MDRRFRKELIGAFALTAAILLVIFRGEDVMAVISAIGSALVPVLIGCAVAYVINIIMVSYEHALFKHVKIAWLERHKDVICMILAILSLLLVIAGALIVIIPRVGETIATIANGIPKVISFLRDNGALWSLLPEDISSQLTNFDWEGSLEQVTSWLITGIRGSASNALSAISDVAGIFMSIFMGVIIGIYMLGSKDMLVQQAHRLGKAYLPARVYERALEVLHVFDASFRSFIMGQAIEAVILGSLTAIGMAILQLPYATMVGVVVALSAVIPMFGAFIGAALGALVILANSPVQALIFLVYFVVLQQIEGNLIYPRVVGQSVGLPGLWITIAVIVGGSLFGILGILVGVPFTSALYKLLRFDVRQREAQAKLRQKGLAEAGAAAIAHVTTDGGTRQDKETQTQA